MLAGFVCVRDAVVVEYTDTFDRGSPPGPVVWDAVFCMTTADVIIANVVATAPSLRPAGVACTAVTSSAAAAGWGVVADLLGSESFETHDETPELLMYRRCPMGSDLFD